MDINNNDRLYVILSCRGGGFVAMEASGGREFQSLRDADRDCADDVH